MNKMDLNMTTQAEVVDARPTLWSRVRKGLIFAAPLVVIVVGVLLMGLLIATGPKSCC